MEATPENIVTVLKNQIAQTKRALDVAGYNPTFARDQVAALAQRYGSPALDVGTGACACLAAIMAQSGLSVTAVDHASSAVRIAQERAARGQSGRLEVRYADAAHLPFPDSTYRVVTAFDSLCHAADPVPVIKEMFRVCDRRGVVIITELNAAGRRITQHQDEGSDEKIPALLAPHCRDCKQLCSAHHVTFVCERN